MGLRWFAVWSKYLPGHALLWGVPTMRVCMHELWHTECGAKAGMSPWRGWAISDVDCCLSCCCSGGSLRYTHTFHVVPVTWWFSLVLGKMVYFLFFFNLIQSSLPVLSSLLTLMPRGRFVSCSITTFSLCCPLPKTWKASSQLTN